MRDLIILGLGAHGPEMAEIVDRVNAVQQTWNLLGFISPDGRKVGECVKGEEGWSFSINPEVMGHEAGRGAFAPGPHGLA